VQQTLGLAVAGPVLPLVSRFEYTPRRAAGRQSLGLAFLDLRLATAQLHRARVHQQVRAYTSRLYVVPRAADSSADTPIPELSVGRVDPWVGLGRDFSVFGALGWVGSTIAKVLKI